MTLNDADLRWLAVEFCGVKVDIFIKHVECYWDKNGVYVGPVSEFDPLTNPAHMMLVLEALVANKPKAYAVGIKLWNAGAIVDLNKSHNLDCIAIDKGGLPEAIISAALATRKDGEG